MQSDMAKKMGNEAWEFVDSNQPKNAGAKVHGGKWAFAIKYNDDGSVKEFRARWVMKGFTMVYGEDFDDTYITGMNCSTSNCLDIVCLRICIFIFTSTLVLYLLQLHRVH